MGIAILRIARGRTVMTRDSLPGLAKRSQVCRGLLSNRLAKGLACIGAMPHILRRANRESRDRMIREHLFHKRTRVDALFRWRGGDVSRLEGLSDGVFAVTLTLLIVSLTVPDTFYELWTAFRDLPIFLVCFLLLMMAWRYHYLFFRRYGLEDFPTVALNGAFLFLILLYAYPLKFLATFLWRLVLGDSTRGMFLLPDGVAWQGGDLAQRAGMMYLYAAGIVGVFGVLGLMVLHAWRKRDQLELDELERYLTVTSLRAHCITVLIALLSITVLIAGGQPGVAGIVYFLMGPIHAIEGWRRGVGAERITTHAFKRQSSRLRTAAKDTHAR